MKSFTKGTGATLARTGTSIALALTVVGGFATSGQAATTPTTPAGPTVPAITLSSATGATAGGTVITLTLPASAATKFASGNVGIQFQNSGTPATDKCASAPATNISNLVVTVDNSVSGNLRFLSSTKISIKTPGSSALAGGQYGAYWLICAYNAAPVSSVIPSTATVIGRAVFYVAVAPTVTAVSPNSGPALGGQTITVTGTNFPTSITPSTPMTATLGGVALQNITPVNTTSFTAVTPAKAAGATNLIVTTNGGSSAVAAGNGYTYKNGIVISPNYVATGSSVDVDIQGVGFSALTFDQASPAYTSDGSAPDGAGAHVYLVGPRGGAAGFTYDATGFNTTAGSVVAKPKGETSECVNVVVISDTELICTVESTKSLKIIADTGNGGTYATTYTATSAASNTANAVTFGGGLASSGTWLGATNAANVGVPYAVTIVNSGSAVAPTYQTVVSSGAMLTVMDF